MTTEIYNRIKAELGTINGVDNFPLYKTIMLWNSQTSHVLADANDSYPWLSPACFIEFNNITCENLGKKAQVQHCEYDVVLHIVQDLRMNEDTSILETKLKTYKVMQVLEFGVADPTTGRLTRTAENPNYDNNELIIFEQTYRSAYKDYSAIPTLGSRILTPVITQTFVTTLP